MLSHNIDMSSRSAAIHLQQFASIGGLAAYRPRRGTDVQRKEQLLFSYPSRFYHRGNTCGYVKNDLTIHLLERFKRPFGLIEQLIELGIV